MDERAVNPNEDNSNFINRNDDDVSENNLDGVYQQTFLTPLLLTLDLLFNAYSSLSFVYQNSPSARITLVSFLYYYSIIKFRIHL